MEHPHPLSTTPAGARTGRSDELRALLTERFRVAALYPWQREVIGALLRPSARVLLVAPTGGGKSLCYQFPAVALGGLTLVLSPLISLMEDQVRALVAGGTRATFVASSLPREELARRLAGVSRRDYTIVYAAPERLGSEAFLAALQRNDLSLVAIDEAHCIAQWGHDFRPEYLRIGDALRALAPPRVLACTATATPTTQREILGRLGIPPADALVVLRGFARPNLALAVEPARRANDVEARIAGALSSALGDPAEPRGAAIVYAATRRGSERLAGALRQHGWDAQTYHAGLDPALRARVAGAFSAGRTSVVVATNAFGMGIDRGDVRIVVHAQPPPSIEAYYQEVGRAGRDGAPARGLMLVRGADIVLRRRLCATAPDGGPAAPEDAARAMSLLRSLLRYADATGCRQDLILRYFGDTAPLGRCGACDNCLGRRGAALESDPPAPARGRSAGPIVCSGALFMALRAHRAEVARAQNVPAYVVASDRTLALIASARPLSAAELLSVHGMGRLRVDRYGEAILRIVAEVADR